MDEKPLQDIKIRMTPKERDAFEKRLASKPMYLEFGCGGSTEIAATIGCRMIVSVESDKAWIEKMKENPLIAKRVKDNSIRFHHVDIGPVGGWGAPINESKIKNWPRYCMTPFGTGLDYGFILVDGRFRTSCALAAWSFMSEDTILAIHDYTIRSNYYEVEKFFNVEESVDTLIFFRKKTNILPQSYLVSVMDNLFRP